VNVKSCGVPAEAEGVSIAEEELVFGLQLVTASITIQQIAPVTFEVFITTVLCFGYCIQKLDRITAATGGLDQYSPRKQ